MGTEECDFSFSTVFVRIFGSVRSFYARLHDFVTDSVWDTELRNSAGPKRCLAKTIRIVTLVVRGFRRDRCSLHASSLTFISLLSVVPVLALGLSLARVAGYSDMMRDEAKTFVREMISEPGVPALPYIRSSAAKNESGNSPKGVITVERLENMIDSGFDRINSFNYGALGGLGLIFLFWTVLEMVGKAEAAFNEVWGVKEKRPFLRKFADYTSVIVIVPPLVFAAASIPVVNVLRRHISAIGSDFFISRIVGVNFFRTTWSLLLFSLAFCFLLCFAPNTRVKFSAGMAGGFITALGLGIWLRICMAMQIGVAKYSAFFGSFAALPIVLFWLYVSWEILLAGAEVSYAVQNSDRTGMEFGWNKASLKSKILLAVALLRSLLSEIQNGGGLLDVVEFNKKTGISARLIRKVADGLSAAGIIAETAESPDRYAARRDIGAITIGELALVFAESGTNPESLGIPEIPDLTERQDPPTDAYWWRYGFFNLPIGKIPDEKLILKETENAC